MRRVRFVVFLAVLLVGVVEAQAGILDSLRAGPRLENVEGLLLAGEYKKVNQQYLKDNRKPGKTYGLLDGTVKFLKEVDRDYKAVREFDVAEISSVRPSGDGLLIGGRTVQLQQTLDRKPHELPSFSSAFLGEINGRLRDTRTQYNVIVAAYNDRIRREAEARAANEIRARESRIEKMRARDFEKEREILQRAEQRAIEKRELAQKSRARAESERRNDETRQAEAARINQSALAAGFDGFEDTNILDMLAKTQRDGGLEGYLGKVIGCGPAASRDNGFGEFDYCKRWYPLVRILQVGDEKNLFQFHTSNEFAHSDRLFFVVKEAGKLYQEGQSIDGRFHVFVGMHTYATALGASRTVPVFRRVDLNHE